MQAAEVDSSAPADSPSNFPQSPAGPDPDLDLGPGLSEAENPTTLDHQCTSKIPTALHGTTSHVDSPHPTQEADAQVDQVISPTGVASNRRLSISSSKMLFSDLYKSTKSPLSRLRRHSNPAPASSDFDPDLMSRDKSKQKDAIKRVLAKKIRDDWHFEWSPSSAKSKSGNAATGAAAEPHQDDIVQDETDSEDEAASTYSTVSEDLTQFRPRVEWLSDIPDDEDDGAPMPPLAYRFDSPDAIGVSVKSSALDSSAKRRKQVRDEMEWNDGLACFNARRDAWTGAKVARVRPKPATSPATSPTSKRLSFWHLSNSPLPSPTDSLRASTSLSPSATRTSGDTTVVSSSDADYREAKTREDSSTYPVETLIPVPQPLLPPNTPMRASITAATYPTIYDKIVLQSAIPSCPVNLGDVVRACVAGWKRDGEWPPRAAEPPPVVAVRRRKKESSPDQRPNASKRMSFSFLGRRQSVAGDPAAMTGVIPQPDREETSRATNKAFRKSIQRVLGLGHERTVSNTSNTSAVAG